MKADRTLIAVLSASNFVIGMGAFVVIGMVERVADGFAISLTASGWMLTIYALAYAVLSPLLVALTGRIGRRRVLAFALGVFALAAVLSALATSYEMLLAVRVLAAAGAGVFTPVTAAVAAGLSAPETRARAMAAVFFGLTLAQVLGVPLGAWVAYTLGWRAAFAIAALLALPCLWLIWTRVPAGLTFQPVQLPDLARVLRNPVLMLAVAFTATFLSGIHVVFTYLTPLLTETMGYGRNGITLILLAAGLGAVAGNIAGGKLADTIGPGRTLTLLAVGQIATLPVFSWLPMPDVLLLGFVFLWAAIAWSFMAAQQSRLVSLSADDAPVLLSLNAAAIYVGTAIGGAIGGLVLSVSTLSTLGLTGGLVGVIALINIAVSRRSV